ncbi:hypothetical protein Tsubulata_032330 [Turnera subulata]|uniref:RanBP2-type domain-containing protein n=1 Tax=Turnera subulata TaxID=218843 RepID=A0A9Q0JDX0_9ROSI|nr:hypothetical protein Tsubulata_032330 [Turnera subulata]
MGQGGREGDWECSGCQNRNYAFRTFCNRCKQPRLLVDSKTPPDSKWLPRIGDWICSGLPLPSLSPSNKLSVFVFSFFVLWDVMVGVRLHGLVAALWVGVAFALRVCGTGGGNRIGCTNNNYASREQCKKCGQPKEVAAMPAIAIPGASLPTDPHYFARPPGELQQKVAYGLASNALPAPPPTLSSSWSADNYGAQSSSAWPLAANQIPGLLYAKPANQLYPVPKGWRNGDWICNCGYHNYSSRSQCKSCNASMPPAIGTKRPATEENMHDWENKRLNSGNQAYPTIDDPRLLGVAAPLPGVGLGAAPGWQMPVQFPQQTTPALLGKGAKQWRNGDWMCTNCNNHNYASRAECNRCKTQRDGIADSVSQPVNVV